MTPLFYAPMGLFHLFFPSDFSPSQPERSRRLPGKTTFLHLSSLNASMPSGMPVGRGERFFTSLRLRLNLWAFGRCFDSAQHDPLVLHTCGIVSFIFPIRLPGKTTFLHLSSLNASRPPGMPVGRGERFFTSLRLRLNLWAFGRCFDSAQHDPLVLHTCGIVSFIFSIRLFPKSA